MSIDKKIMKLEKKLEPLIKRANSHYRIALEYYEKANPIEKVLNELYIKRDIAFQKHLKTIKPTWPKK